MVQGKVSTWKKNLRGWIFIRYGPKNGSSLPMETLCKQPNKSIQEAGEDRAEAKVVYRMPGNENFDREEILRAHREAVIGRTAGYGGTILTVQDTAGVNYKHSAGEARSRCSYMLRRITTGSDFIRYRDTSKLKT
jgi:hypothetical protein